MSVQGNTGKKWDPISVVTRTLIIQHQIHKQKKRYFSKSLFSRKLSNGEFVQREWLLYSPSKGTIFCFACKLFGTNCSLTYGYSDWKNAYLRLSEHEGSKCHRDTMMIYLKRCANGSISRCLWLMPVESGLFLNWGWLKVDWDPPWANADWMTWHCFLKVTFCVHWIFQV